MKMSVTPYVLLALCALTNGGLLRRPALDGRIVGGKPTDIYSYPYQVSLTHYSSHSCGASIISENWVVTAAHCVYGRSAYSLGIRAGSSFQGLGGTMYTVAEVIAHEKFSMSSTDYDFAVVKINSKFNLGEEGIQAIEMTSIEPAAGDIAVITGWGALSSGGGSPSQLQVVEVPIVEREVCNKAYGSITDRMICAGLTEGGKDACQGDSGGPLVVDGKLTGIVSWGNGCASPRYPGVYSNVANGRTWIREQTGI